MRQTTRGSFLKNRIWPLGPWRPQEFFRWPPSAPRPIPWCLVVQKIEVTQLAFGTGTNGGAVQAALGQQEFTRLGRCAYARGIRGFETAEAYETPGMLGEALKGLPLRQLMSKVTTFHHWY